MLQGTGGQAVHGLGGDIAARQCQIVFTTRFFGSIWGNSYPVIIVAEPD